MALRVWLPLNGNLDNLGASNGTVATTVTNAWDTNGKIGTCALSNIKASYTFPELTDITNFSISYWLYIDSSVAIQSWADIWGINCVAGSSSTIIRDEFTSAVGAHQLLMGKDSTVGSNTNTYIGTGISTSSAKDKWVHITLVKDNTTAKVYTNGVLTNTINSSTFESTPQKLTGYLIIGNTTSSAAKLNDFRLYDHCLSALEIKEISQGLILHYKLDRVTNNNMLVNSKRDSGLSHTTYAVVDFNFNESVVAGEQYTVTAKINTSSEKKAIGFYHSGGSYPMGGWMPISSNGVYITTFTATSNMASQTANAGHGYCRVYASNNAGTSQGSTTVTGTANVEWIKVERGTKSSGWSPAPSEGGGHQVIDSSGYGHNGTISALANSKLNSGRYNNGILLDKKKITCSSGFLTTADPVFTISFWFKLFSNITYASYADLVSFEATNSSQLFRLELCGSPAGNNLMWFRGPTGTSGGFNAGPSSSGWCSKDVWHQIALVSNGNKQYTCYFDGVQTSTYDGSANSWTPVGSLGIGDTAEGTAEFADYRIYATALSADDILALYNNPANVDKSGKFHTFEFIENNNNSIKKNGIIQCNEIIEETIPVCQYDSQIYTEPDGSQWIRIYHINNPGAGSFASTDTFATGVYKDANRWYDATRVCNQLNKWEFLVKYKFTSSGTEYKERWIQTKNPENAVFADVDAADITRITTSGYKAGTWGGLYKKNASAYWVMNNGNSGNWWGATGGFSIYQSGTPGYGGTVTTTGFNDLYVRIDNIQTNARITKTGNYIGSGFIEK